MANKGYNPLIAIQMALADEIALEGRVVTKNQYNKQDEGKRGSDVNTNRTTLITLPL